MMDLGADGDPRLSVGQTYSGLGQTVLSRRANKKSHAKTELSLMNFACQNPDWKPPAESEALVQNIRNLWHKDLQQVIDQQQITASTIFGPMSGANFNVLTSMSKSIRESEKIRTPPSSPSTFCQSQQKSTDQSTMMPPGAFSDSATAALSASSMMRSMQQNSFIQAPTARYFNTVIQPNVQGTPYLFVNPLILAF